MLLTDLGVIDKLDAQQNHWVFVQSFRTGNPVTASVEVLAKNGSVVIKRSTDANGAVTLPPLKDFTNEKTPVALVVRDGDDVSFLPFNRSDRNLVPNGCYVISDVEGNATYKRYRSGPMRFEPVSTNPQHEPIFPDNDPIIVGRVRRSIINM